VLPKLKSVTLKNGQVVELSDGVTVVVGPNNAGKSVLLREMIEHVGNTENSGSTYLTVGSVGLEWPGTQDEFIAWIGETYGAWRPPGQYPDGRHHELTARTVSGLLSESQVRNAWGNASTVRGLNSICCLQLDAQSRLGVGLDGGAFNPRQQSPTDPVQHLFASRELEEQMSALMQRAFGEELTVDRYAGSEVHLLVGRPQVEEPRPPVTDEYLKSLSSLRRLSAQGDGMRAFMGMLLTIKTSKYRLIVILTRN
jgi:ABC-type cobalamin/Fe3+-siderophores transport system ATPase subunit